MIGNFEMMRCEVSTLIRLPPPLRGRVGERGKPRVLADDMRREYSNEPVEVFGEEVVLALRQPTEQAAPLSLTLPRKGGGNPSVGTSLTYVGTTVIGSAVASIGFGSSR
ncbi:hypothetical protein LMTR3_04270 [Bradyrhizobium sp. LMTR 3]|nr:hypothetical protein LMTR3_04270 [Bradyrhizobium sp. LMTR 3]